MFPGWGWRDASPAQTLMISQLYAFAKAHRTKIILFYVNKKISKKKINRGGLTEGIILCRGVTKTA